jgi:ribonuclease HIII
MEQEILEKLESYDVVIGIDEVGRGPIAGPVPWRLLDTKT